MNRLKFAMIWGFVAGAAAAWAIWCEVFVTDDSYFYLVIARNIVEHGEHSFSRVIPTNGFHPLWGYLLVAWDFLLHFVHPALLEKIQSALPLSIGLLFAAVVMTRRVAGRLDGSKTVAAAIPLVLMTYLGVLYSEAHFSWFCLAWLCDRVTREAGDSRRDAALVGFAAGCCFLARLDSIFTVISLLLWWFWRRPVWPRACISGSCAAVLVVPYLISNLVFFGGLMPVSGWMKSTFPAIQLKGFHYEGLPTTLFGYSVCLGLVPLVIGVAILAALRPRLREPTAVIWALALGTAGHSLYIALFTRGHTEPYWYYVQPVFFFALVAGAAVTRNGRLLRVSEGGAAVGLAATLVLLFTVRPNSIHETRQYVPEALAYLRAHAIQDRTILVSDCPGKIAFFTGNGVFAADFLTANRNFYSEMKESGDALECIRRRSQEAGRPLSHVLYLGNVRLVPSEDGSSVIYFDPRTGASKPIGQFGPADGLSAPEFVGMAQIWTLKRRTAP